MIWFISIFIYEKFQLIKLFLRNLTGWRKKNYTSINFMRNNLGSMIFFPPAPTMYNNEDRNKILITKLDYKE